jgi:hypothetical protein
MQRSTRVLNMEGSDFPRIQRSQEQRNGNTHLNLGIIWLHWAPGELGELVWRVWPWLLE